MRIFYLLRHAQAVLPDHHGRDFDRPLTASGRSHATAQAERLIATGCIPDAVLCSSAVRTTQTAEIFCDLINSKTTPATPLQPLPVDALYRADADGYIDCVRAFALQNTQTLLLVGHNPSIEECALLFAKHDQQLTHKLKHGYPTAGLAKIETASALSDLSPDEAKLTALYFPQNT